MHRRSCVMVLGCVLTWSLAAASQAAPGGLYTDAQADRGRSVYLASCSRCHGETLLGNDDATPLVGDPFMKIWTGRPAAALLISIRVRMPTDGPGVLTRRETADVSAYLLRANGFPSGTTELPTNERLLEGVHLEPPPP